MAHRARSFGPSGPPAMSWITSWDVSEAVLAAGTRRRAASAMPFARVKVSGRGVMARRARSSGPSGPPGMSWLTSWDVSESIPAAGTRRDAALAMPFARVGAAGGGDVARLARSFGPSGPPAMTWTTSWDVSKVVPAAGTLPGRREGSPSRWTRLYAGGMSLAAGDTSTDVLANRLPSAGSIHPAGLFSVVLTRQDASRFSSDTVFGGICHGTCLARGDASFVTLGDWPAGAGIIHSVRVFCVDMTRMDASRDVV